VNQHAALPLRNKRANSLSHLPLLSDARTTVSMTVDSYLVYEKLIHQQRSIQRTYDDIDKLTRTYANTAQQLKKTYEDRVHAFDEIQKASRQVTDEQVNTERRLKHVEDHSAKLQYELKVLNDNLKDIEDNVGTFFGKVGILDRKMEDEQQSMTWFRYYYVKIREWWFKSKQE
jgi:chromosome segregation ATPase